jgi:3-hydroxyisobutyrate dehydrogenase-like beta-hydroxyacid dehydrogenase
MSAPETFRPETAPLIGFIGVGAMGGPMARNLLKAGYRLTVFDLDVQKVEACVEAGATAAKHATELVKQSKIVLTSLPSSTIFVEVAETDLAPHAKSGQIFIDFGTTEAVETRRLAGEFIRKKATLLDAPVSGGSAGAETGKLRIFVGGDSAAVERCRPLLEVLGEPERVIYCGPTGSGQIVKGVNQLAMGLGVAAYLEALAFGVRGGVDPAIIAQAVGGGEESWRAYFTRIVQHVMAGTPENADIKFPELPYFLGEAYEQGFDLPLTEALFNFCDAGSRDWLDNMGRQTVAFWYELMNRAGKAIVDEIEM